MSDKFICILTPENDSLILEMKSLFNIEFGSECILNVSLRSGDESFQSYIPENLYINGVLLKEYQTVNNNYTIRQKLDWEIKNSPVIFMFRLENENEKFFTGSISVEVMTGGQIIGMFSVQISDSGLYSMNDTSLECNMLSTPLESYMLLRTNPKLSGNIKLVCDSSYHLYLDTFKVSNILNNRIYRKYPVSADGNYAHDVMTVFSSLPDGELFKLPADSLNPHKFYNDYRHQYLTEYEYGAETNTDNLYPENMKILAPMHIGKNIPDFFCVFRYEGTHNEESYRNIAFDDKEKFITLLKDSKVVKTFDLRTYTSIGQYLNRYRDSINDFLYGSCYMQFIEQDNDLYGENYRQGNNSWKGIDVKRGIITNKIETTYFANNVLNEETGVQEKFNHYILNGYERNNILYPYILNIEFMFNDNDVEEYEMNRYFGLYLSANDFIEYDCIINDNDNHRLKLDKNDNIIKDEYIFSKIFNNSYDDRLFYMITNDFADRVSSIEDTEKFINKYVLNHPDKNITTTDTEPVEFTDEMKSFITLSFTEPVKYGEHLRFISQNVYNKKTDSYENICLELIASNDERLASCDDFINPYISTNVPEIHKCSQIQSSSNHIYRISFYTQDETDHLKSATIEEQIRRICKCINKFGSFVTVSSTSMDTIGIVSELEDVYFQHISVPNQENSMVFRKLMYSRYKRGEMTLYYEPYNDDESSSFILNEYEMMKPEITGIGTMDIQSSGEDVYVDNDYKIRYEKIIQFVDYEKSYNQIKDSIRYFNRTVDSVMYPISPESYYFTNKYAVFSMSGYDILGWRFQNVVPFKKVSEISYGYVTYGDIESVIKTVKHPLVKMKNGLYDVISEIKTENGYVSLNTALMCGLEKHTQKLYFHNKSHKTIICPYNVNGNIISFKDEIKHDDFRMHIFKPESASVAVMGILSIKDMDMNVNLKREKTVTENLSVELKTGDVLLIDNNKDMRIRTNIVYEIEYGKFNEFSAYRFMISDNVLYYTQEGNESEVYTKPIYNGTLVVASDMKLKTVDSNVYQKYSYKDVVPMQQTDNFFIDKTDKKKSSLKIPVVPLTNCLWESNGIYLDDNSIMDINNLLKVPYKKNGRFNEHVYTPAIDE